MKKNGFSECECRGGRPGPVSLINSPCSVCGRTATLKTREEEERASLKPQTSPLTHSLTHDTENPGRPGAHTATPLTPHPTPTPTPPHLGFSCDVVVVRETTRPLIQFCTRVSLKPSGGAQSLLSQVYQAKQVCGPSEHCRCDDCDPKIAPVLTDEGTDGRSELSTEERRRYC